MKYEAGNHAIMHMISMKRAFKGCPKMFFFYCWSHKSYSTKSYIHNPRFFMINLQQNGYHLNALFMLITMVQIPPSYLIPSPRYLAKYIQTTQHLT